MAPANWRIEVPVAVVVTNDASRQTTSTSTRTAWTKHCAGVRKLVGKGVIGPGEEVVCVLTGNLLKDPDASVQYHTGSIAGVEQTYANRPIVIDADMASVERALKG